MNHLPGQVQAHKPSNEYDMLSYLRSYNYHIRLSAFELCLNRQMQRSYCRSKGQLQECQVLSRTIVI
jgi:hypothetical protein